MSAACSPGGGQYELASPASNANRETLIEVQMLIRLGRVEEARKGLRRIKDPELKTDWMILRVEEILAGGPTEGALREASDLIAEMIAEVE